MHICSVPRKYGSPFDAEQPSTALYLTLYLRGCEHSRTVSGDQNYAATDAAAVDTVTIGIMPKRDRLCAVLMFPGNR